MSGLSSKPDATGSLLSDPPVPSAPSSAPDMSFDGRMRLEDLVDREGLEELCTSFFALFGIPVRIYSTDGALLADASKEHEICGYVNTLITGRAACGATVSAVKADEGGVTGDVVHPCFTGNAYRIVVLEYDARKIGRIIIGPYLPPAVTEVPQSLLDIDKGIDPARARSLLPRVPRAKEETITRIATHLKSALDLILFSGHKALLTSTMHLASVRESYRELQEKNARLQESFGKLKELDRLKSNFLATVSHELRTPLTSIIGYSEMLTEGIAGPLAGEQKEFVGTIHEKGEQLLGLITSLLDLSKLESGSMSVKKRAMRVQDLLDQVVSTLTPTARKRGVLLKLEFGDDIPEVKGDPERLRQVFLNLADNAVKFTPTEGSVTLTVRNLGVDAGADDEDGDASGFALLAPVQSSLEIRVADTGIGIPARERAKVFDPFYQIDSSSTREYGGTGLGLSIVKRLVDAHGGTIHIEDNIPQGTVFVVRLPASDPTA
jgi:two-component system sensor histidine kinase BarA